MIVNSNRVGVLEPGQDTIVTHRFRVFILQKAISAVGKIRIAKKRLSNSTNQLVVFF